MTDQEVKAEADKITQEFIPVIDPSFGKLIKKTVWTKATQCAIIHVKRIKKEWEELNTSGEVGDDKEFSLHTYNKERRDFWQSILTELQNR